MHSVSCINTYSQLGIVLSMTPSSVCTFAQPACSPASCGIACCTAVNHAILLRYCQDACSVKCCRDQLTPICRYCTTWQNKMAERSVTSLQRPDHVRQLTREPSRSGLRAQWQKGSSSTPDDPTAKAEAAQKKQKPRSRVQFSQTPVSFKKKKMKTETGRSRLELLGTLSELHRVPLQQLHMGIKTLHSGVTKAALLAASMCKVWQNQMMCVEA